MHTQHSPSQLKTALFAGGCFWCIESDFEKLTGVASAVSGYAGGEIENPTYKNYSRHGCREAVEVSYDPTVVSYRALVEYLIKHSDPTDADGSFHDRGLQYAPAIYFDSDEEKEIAKKLIDTANAQHIYEKPLAIAVLPRVKFWPAEDYHQDYYKKNPIPYRLYRLGSGRDGFIKKHLGDDILRAKLTPLQYKVTQKGGTESPFHNEYNDNHREGIYVDIVSGESLFSSSDKYDSGTGWPSFVKPISNEAVVLYEDRSFFGTRAEVRSRLADSHLGHIFEDGPADRGGKRYCMNSAALRFIPREEMEEKGYGEYFKLFE